MDSAFSCIAGSQRLLSIVVHSFPPVSNRIWAAPHLHRGYSVGGFCGLSLRHVWPFVCFVDAIYDLVLDVETMFDLCQLLTASNHLI